MRHNEKVVSIKLYVLRRAAENGFAEWRKLFRTFNKLDENTRWSDLPDWLLLFLCEESRESQLTMYELLMGSLGLGKGDEFESLTGDSITNLLNIYFFLTDQIRFECMRRLEWIEKVPLAEKSIIETIMDLKSGKYPYCIDPPAPGETHPCYKEDHESSGVDRASLVRQYIPDAINAFRKKTQREKRLKDT